MLGWGTRCPEDDLTSGSYMMRQHISRSLLYSDISVAHDPQVLYSGSSLIIHNLSILFIKIGAARVFSRTLALHVSRFGGLDAID